MNFIDSHVHYIEEDPLEYIETLLRRMDEHDIEKAVLFGVQGHPLCSDAGVWHVANRYPDRFIPFACSIRCEHTRDAEVFLQYLRNWGPWMGVGEIFVDLGPMEAPTPYIDRHGRQCVYPRYCPEDKSHNQVYAEVFSYCADNNLPVLVHCVDVKTMEDVLKRFPSTIFIWAHADWWLPETDTVPLLEERSNLYCEIGPQFRVASDQLIEGENQPDWLLPRFKGWQEAAQKHSSRIIWGSDVFAWDDIEPQRYKRFIDVWQLFCEPISKALQEKIAYRNLLSLLRLNG